MTIIEHRKHARELREQGELEAAGEFYVASGFGYLMRFRKTEGDSISPRRIGGATQMLMLGALCFHCIDDEERARRYCSIGREVVTDLRTREESFLRSHAPAPVGLTYELEGDFLLLGDLGDFEEAYDHAMHRYVQVENPYQWSVEPEFEVPLLVLSHLSDSVGFDSSEDEGAAIRTSLVDRIEFKREHFGTIIEGVIDDGNWESETW